MTFDKLQTRIKGKSIFWTSKPSSFLIYKYSSFQPTSQFWTEYTELPRNSALSSSKLKTRNTLVRIEKLDGK